MNHSDTLNLFTRIDQWKNDVINQTSFQQEQGTSYKQSITSRLRVKHRMNLRSSAKRQGLQEISANVRLPEHLYRPSADQQEEPPTKRARRMAPPKKKTMDGRAQETSGSGGGKQQAQNVHAVGQDAQSSLGNEEGGISRTRSLRSGQKKPVSYAEGDAQAMNEEEDEAYEAGYKGPISLSAATSARGLAHRHPPSIVPVESFAPPTSTSSRQPSPKRNTGQDWSKRFKLGHLTMTHLKRADPPVFIRDMTQLRQEGGIPKAVQNLYGKLSAVRRNAIPRELKDDYAQVADSPRKSRPAPEAHEYSATGVPFPVTHGKLLNFRERVDAILEEARWNDAVSAHERQWGSTVSAFLREFTFFDYEYAWKLVNVENCAINPNQVRPTINDGTKKELINELNEDGAASETPSEREDRALSKMIDWCLTLSLQPAESAELESLFSTLSHYECSVNQTTSYLQECPIFTDVEMKKANMPDPRIQLAVWASAGLKKRRCHGYQIMLGPIDLGSTGSRRGIWELAHKMHLLIEWGTTEYKAWFDKNVLKKKVNEGEEGC
ncbi:uncharacterized protein KY384_000009 [Bacidia gigantensis]|uniref:uncharacterized protein n=1 Tax=Bacidia gigantensis TaxID=2732470 RepID=UPI001D0417B0|nr:uncharacterized protein KY384_000009 [Bacidia gigantensis]KAG8526416.1 hypothetical protein KY384_000009 [Bacidia gigantensis]